MSVPFHPFKPEVTWETSPQQLWGELKSAVQSGLHKELAFIQLPSLLKVGKQVSSASPGDLNPILLLRGVLDQNRPWLRAAGGPRTKDAARKTVFLLVWGNGIFSYRRPWGLDIGGHEHMR